MYYSYARVSTNKQEHLRQEKAIDEYCEKEQIVVKQLFKDIMTGTVFNRPEFNKMKEIVKEGDTVIIKELDRLGRNWDGIKAEWKCFSDHKVNIYVIDIPILSESIYKEDGTVDLNKKLMINMMLDLMSYSAEIEKNRNSARTSESLRAKQAEGMVLGRPVDKEKHKAIIELFKQGYNKSDIAFECECTRATVYSVLRENGLIPKKS